MTSTTWNAIAVVLQFWQFASAQASFWLATGPSSLTQTSARATWVMDEPSWVLIASAWLSPLSGRSGGSNGNGQPCLTSPPAAWATFDGTTPVGCAAPVAGAAGTTAIAQCPEGAAAAAVAWAGALGGVGGAGAGGCAAGRMRGAAGGRLAWSGWYWPFGHQAHATAVASSAAANTAPVRRAGRPAVARQTPRAVRWTTRVRM